MKKTDGRKLTHEQSEYIRIQAVRAVRRDKRSPEDVIATFGLHRTNIYKWLRMYKKGGLKALKSSRGTGKKPTLSKEELKKLSRLLEKNPLQLRFEFALWTQPMIQALIKKRFKKEVSIVTVGRILKQIGYTKQRPIYKAYEQNPEQVKAWKEQEYPTIKQEAKEGKREIYFIDEAGFEASEHRGGTWGKKGKTPVVKKTGKRYRTNSISAITNKGELRFMVYDGKFNSKVMIEFLKRLLHKHSRKITLIVDCHSVHKSKEVKQFIAWNNSRLKVYFLPPYSPELNPDELVWNNAKARLAKVSGREKRNLKAKVGATLHSIQKNETLVKSLFRNPYVSYAA